jgi:hypothetical protein
MLSLSALLGRWLYFVREIVGWVLEHDTAGVQEG